jgi:diguanylate cyclase (GGDEF)-like protein
LLAILFIDMDRFKSINDSLGHKIGDLLLQAVAGRIQRLLEPGDEASRFGGDEFVVLLAGERSEEQINGWVRALVEKLSATYALDGQEVNTSPSVGVSICPRDGQDIDALIRCADAAMYSAKQAGRAQYRFFDPSLNLSDIQAFTLEQAFGSALRAPVRCTFSRRSASTPCRCWATKRWCAGTIRSSACSTPTVSSAWPSAAVHRRTGLGGPAPGLRGAGTLGCARSGRAPGGQCVGAATAPGRLQRPAVGRTRLLRHRPSAWSWRSPKPPCSPQGTAVEHLHRLRAAGIGISLDDFGRGYAGFAHLQALPLSRLKIDRSLIAPLSNSYDDSPIVSSTIILAKRLGLEVVAEGVETREQVVCLKLAGCDIAQGYHFSRPLSPAQLHEYPLHRQRGQGMRVLKPSAPWRWRSCWRARAGQLHTPRPAPGGDPDQGRRSHDPRAPALVERLSKAAGVPVELVISASYESVVDAIVSGGADIARLGPALYPRPPA